MRLLGYLTVSAFFALWPVFAHANDLDSIVDRIVSHMEAVASAIEEVQDESTAMAAAGVIAAHANEMEALSNEFDGLSEAEQVELAGLYRERLQGISERLAFAARTLASNPELMRILSQELQKIPNFR